jgi:hypothetical protein
LISQSDNENIEIYKINTGMESKIFSQKKEVRISTRQHGSYAPTVVMEDPRMPTPGHDGDHHDNMNMSMRTKKTEFLTFSNTNFCDAKQNLKDDLYISKNSFQGAPMPKSCLKESFMFGPGNFRTPDNANAPTGEKEGFLRSMPVLLGHHNPQD